MLHSKHASCYPLPLYKYLAIKIFTSNTVEPVSQFTAYDKVNDMFGFKPSPSARLRFEKHIPIFCLYVGSVVHQGI
jgi:hypothetical protein